MYGIDPLYFAMMAPVLLFSLWASFSVKSRFKKYSQIGVISGMTGAKAAEHILRSNGVTNVTVERTSGFLSDHYDPRSNVIRLSDEVYSSSSIAAVGVAAHEAGHAIQHAQKYAPLAIRNMIAPVASIGTYLSYGIIILGFILSAVGLVKIGIVVFTVVVIFQIITLPVEFNASNRAKEILVQTSIVRGDEAAGVNSVLSAAAMTYVAAAASAVVTLLYYVLQVSGMSSRD